MCTALNDLYHTIPHRLCRCQVKDVHSLQSCVSTHSEESDSLLFILCLQYQMLLTSALSKQNSATSLEEWVLVFKVFTTGTRKFTVKQASKQAREATDLPLEQGEIFHHAAQDSGHLSHRHWTLQPLLQFIACALGLGHLLVNGLLSRAETLVQHLVWHLKEPTVPL